MSGRQCSEAIVEDVFDGDAPSRDEAIVEDLLADVNAKLDRLAVATASAV